MHGDVALCHWYRHRPSRTGGWNGSQLTHYNPVMSQSGSLQIRVDHPVECLVSIICACEGDLDAVNFCDLALIWTIDPDVVLAALPFIEKHLPAMREKFSRRRMGWLDNLEFTRRAAPVSGRENAILFDFFTWIADNGVRNKGWFFHFNSLEKRKRSH